MRPPMPDNREACLKPEFAYLYPGLTPGVWYRAAWLSARQFAREPCDGAAASIARMVDGHHFEFRGGRPRNAQPDKVQIP
jgi:hypothetical protein